jgi:hypothetical protein
MKHNYLKGICGLLMIALVIVSLPKTVMADAEVKEEDTSYDRYIAFGEDLSKSEKQKVMDSFGITKSDLKNYKTIKITNKEEHEYLGDYIASSVIGKRALSSVMVVKTEKGSGVHVTTDNISYCTSGMYTNALVTAGLEDAEVKVTGPFKISGTSALVGAMKAYSVMTGKEISEDTMDAATNELVATANLAEAVGDSDKAEQLIAAAKEKVLSQRLTKREDIKKAIESSAKELGIEVPEDEVDKLVTMMQKVSKVDVNVDALKKQAGEIYNKLKDAGIDLSNVDTKGLAQKIGAFFANIFEAIVRFFSGLFG